MRINQNLIDIGARSLSSDFIRVFAMFLVVFAHIDSDVIFRFKSYPLSTWAVVDIFDTICRISVPLFVMVSGSLLLSKDEDYGTFFKKRFIKIIIPVLFWIEIYVIWRIFFKQDITNWLGWIDRIVNGPVYYHLWFLYMLIGLYALTPVLRKLMLHLSQKDIIYLLALWFILFSLIPSIAYLIPQDTRVLFPFVSYFSPGYLWNVFSYSGFFVLGGFLVNHSFTPKEIQIAGIMAVVLILLATYWHTTMSMDAEGFYTIRDPLIPLFIPITMASIMAYIFLNHYLVDKERTISPRFNTAISQLAQASFGIYLVHPIIRDILGSGMVGVKISALAFNPLISIPIAALVVFTVSGILSIVMKKVPALRMTV